MRRLALIVSLLCTSTWAIAQAPVGPVAPASAVTTTLPMSQARMPADAKEFEQVSRRAAAGDSDAMMRLGELYWYGDGLPLDRDKGDALFRRAAAAGNPGAAEALQRSGARQQRLAEIAYWTGGITARQLPGAEFDCKGPEFPTYSDIRVDAAKVVASYENYRTCYNSYVDKLFGDLPTVRRIPADLAALMSDDEFEQARVHVDALVASTVATLKQRSAPVLAERDRWVERSIAYITTQELRRHSARVVGQANERACNGLKRC